ncbi:SurA N-terminal domain-containing protein [Segnochrobactraceae bacterium EtOH-i3]
MRIPAPFHQAAGASARSLRSVLLAAALGIAALAPAHAQQIKVVVNDQVITTGEIAARAKFLSLTQRPPNPERAAMEELIAEKLQVQEAKRLGLNASKAEVDNAFASIATRVKLTPAQLEQALAQAGAPAKTLKDRIYAQIVWGQVVRKRFRQSVNVSEQDVIAALQAKGGTADKNKTMEFDITTITFVVPKAAGDAGFARRQKEAENLRARFTACDQGIEFARSLPEVVVKPVGRRLQSEVPPDMLTNFNNTSVGRLTPPERNGAGIEMIAICGKRELSSDAAARKDMEIELMTNQGELTSRRFLLELRRNAVIEYK